MFVVDTNVLVYAANAAAPEHARCRDLLEGWRHGSLPWCLTWGILYEFLRVCTHPRVFATPWPAAQAWAFVDAVRVSPGLSILVETDRHASMVDRLLGADSTLAGNLIHDVHTAALMLEHGVRRIYTRDADFHRFSDIEVIDPVRG